MKRIDVKGAIIAQEDKWIYDWLEYPYTCAEDVNSALLDAKGDDVEVYINSYGGHVHVGSEIYTSLKDYKGNVLIKIVGLAASAASVISMGGKCVMSPTGQMMIHNASVGANGDYRVMDKTSQMLQSTNKSILNAYKFKSGLSEGELKDIMDNETWLTAERAKELKLIDGIMFEENNQENNVAPVLYNSLPIPSAKVVEEMRMCGSIEKFKETIAKNQVIESSNKNISNKEGKQMNLDTLKSQYPDLCDAIFQEGVKAEKERIQAIEEIHMPGFENEIKDAKFKDNISAEKLALNLVKASANREEISRMQYLKNLEEDKNVLNESVAGLVPSQHEPFENKANNEKPAIISNFINQWRDK